MPGRISDAVHAAIEGHLPLSERKARDSADIPVNGNSTQGNQCTSHSDVLSLRMKVLWEGNLRNDEKEGKESPLGGGRLDGYVAGHDTGWGTECRGSGRGGGGGQSGNVLCRVVENRVVGT